MLAIFIVLAVILNLGQCFEELHFLDDDTHEKVCEPKFIKDEHLEKFVACEKDFRNIQDKLAEEVGLILIKLYISIIFHHLV